MSFSFISTKNGLNIIQIKLLDTKKLILTLLFVNISQLFINEETNIGYNSKNKKNQCKKNRYRFIMKKYSKEYFIIF
jgi:hypothetical protein